MLNLNIVAIKKFKESDSDEIIRKTSIREVKILRMLDHVNIVKLKEAFRRKGKLYLVFEFMDYTLLEVMEKEGNGLDENEIRLYIYQMLKAIGYLHEMEILHRDIKPENLLINDAKVLKVCDFGFARALNPNGGDLTSYVATRWYRSPELLITANYGREVDIWAIGCIMGELVDGNPLFAGDNLIDQLDVIQKVMGTVPTCLLNLMKNNPELRAAKFKQVKTPETLDSRYRGVISSTGLDLLKQLLEMDPSLRPSAKQALLHPYFDCYKEDSERRVKKGRVSSSTYRTSGIGLFREEGSSIERIPSYSQGRRQTHGAPISKGRSESRVKEGAEGHSLIMSSTLNNGFAERKTSVGKKSQKKDFALSTHNGGFKYSNKKLDEKGENSENSAWKKKFPENKKSKNNFRMFRIKEESEYPEYGKKPNTKSKSKSKGKKQKNYQKEKEMEDLGQIHPFLPKISNNLTTKREVGAGPWNVYSRSMHYSKGNLHSESKANATGGRTTKYKERIEI